MAPEIISESFNYATKNGASNYKIVNVRLNDGR